ncbi:875_t:CDS:2 [Funneliformis geosporum]|uniref:2349_t:CDS:1 n=1 Tax=Funneliformis geosporum TaxID=1117311 RepID=A0A9W4SL92_9GLOM|nr:875_t:CDS:2 [Funneliformis geosporum]CAI2171080.1 2349_t:CDS:2 [Funneliformis geosporum]
MTCVPAAIATYIEVAGIANTDESLQNNHLGANNSPNEKKACSGDGVWCFKVVSVDGRQGLINYSVIFANRESTVQSSDDADPLCSEPKANEHKCRFEIINHGFDV